MKHVSIQCLLLSMLLACLPVQAQYKWIGPDGRVTYSDQPPPANTKAGAPVPAANNTPTTPAASGLPYAVSRAAQNFPVTLYTIKECSACDQGRNHLQSRGVPFQEKTISTQADADALKKISSENNFPILAVGNQKQVGFESSPWNQILDLAGYPKDNQLPRNYKNPAPTSLAGESKPAKPDTGSAPPVSQPVTPNALPKPDNAPPGFRF